jgi:hypothetical protein
MVGGLILGLLQGEIMPTWTLLIDPLSKLIDRLIPDPQAAAQAKLELAKEQSAAALQEFQLAVQADQSQAQINQIEAGSKEIFVSGWRPFIGWVCGVAFAYHYVLQPLLAFGMASAGHTVALPAFDMSELSTVLMGMLGLGGLRTIEKIKNVA